MQTSTEQKWKIDAPVENPNGRWYNIANQATSDSTPTRPKWGHTRTKSNTTTKNPSNQQDARHKVLEEDALPTPIYTMLLTASRSQRQSAPKGKGDPTYETISRYCHTLDKYIAWLANCLLAQEKTYKETDRKSCKGAIQIKKQSQHFYGFSINNLHSSEYSTCRILNTTYRKKWKELRKPHNSMWNLNTLGYRL